MLNHGIIVIVVSQRLGHARASITLDIYAHLIPTMQVEAVQKIDELITPVEVSPVAHALLLISITRNKILLPPPNLAIKTQNPSYLGDFEWAE